MRRTALLFPLLALTALGQGCGNGTRIEPDRSLAVAGSQFGLVSGTCSMNANREITGSCSIVAASDLGGVNSGSSFALQLRLEDGGSLTLHAFGNRNQQAFNIRFSRTDANLSVRVEVNGQETNYDTQFRNYDARRTIALQIDVHNDETPVHLLIWDQSASPRFGLDQKVINSLCGINNPARDCNNFGLNGRGAGSNFGFTIDNAALLSAIVSAPKYEH